MPEAPPQAHESVSLRTYYTIGTLLLIGTALAFVFADELELSWLATVFLIFGIATAKSTLVAMYFMHLKFEGPWKFILLIPPLLLATALAMALLPDIGGFGRYG